MKPGEKPPIMPLEATQHTPEGAKAFAEFFIKTIDWGYATTSSAYMRHYFQQSCIECANAVHGIDRVKKLHQHFVGDRFLVTGSIAARAGSDSRADPLLRVTFDVTSGEIVDRSNRFIDGEAAHNGYREEVTLKWVVNAWKVATMIPHP